ncbi:MAG: hypothetical protein EAX96_15370 [Candidatus Lokiarchaeota archaeon]|nr:hypothetical protein [Candidatus Lokiarchaeota archaeon]
MELGWFLKASKGKSTEEKVDDLSELVVKVMETFVNVMEQIDNKLTNLGQKINEMEEGMKIDKARSEGEMNALKSWLTTIQSGGITPTAGPSPGSLPEIPGVGPGDTPVTPMAPPQPKPVPKPKPIEKPLSGMGARAALQSELKELFSRMKKE